MKKIIILLFSFFLIFNCQKKRIINKNFLNELSTIERKSKYIPEYLYYILYVKLDNGKYLKTNGQELFNIYTKNYIIRYPIYHDFLDEVLNQKINLEHSIVNNNNAFDLNTNLQEENIEDIIQVYSIKNNDGTYKFNPNINKSMDDYNSILYFFFEKGYKISFDDYLGVFIMKK